MTDIRVDLYTAKAHPMDTILEMGIRCGAMASVPLAGAWWIWDAKWEGELPDGFTESDLTSQRQTPYYQPGMFVNGINGASSPLRDPHGITGAKETK